MTKLHPFADDSTSLSVAGLTVENGTRRVTLYGSLDLTRDKAGLAEARALKVLVDAIVRTLEADHALPDQVAPPEPPRTVENPFE